MTSEGPSLEQMLRGIVRAEIEAALLPLRDQVGRLNLSAPAVSDDDELSLGDAKVVSGYAQDTLRKAIHAGDLAGLKGGKEWRVKRGDLKAWMHKKKPSNAAQSHVDISLEASMMLKRLDDRAGRRAST